MSDQAIAPEIASPHPMVKADPTPLSIIAEFASNPNFDAAKLKALLDMKRDQEQEEARKAFHRDLAKCQEEMPAVIRDAENSQTSSRYTTLDNVSKITKPVLAKYGFSVSFAEGECKVDKWKRTIADLRHKEGHAAQYYIDLPLDGYGAKGNAIGAMNPVQAAISTGTYGQRVLLCRILNLAIADSDQDGQDSNGFITGDQIEVINTLLDTATIELKGVLKWLAIEGLDKMPVKSFDKCVAELKRKQKPQAGAAPTQTAPPPVPKEVTEVLETWKAILDADPNIDVLNKDILADIKKIKNQPVRVAVWEYVAGRVGKAGLVFDEKAKKFVVAGANP